MQVSIGVDLMAAQGRGGAPGAAAGPVVSVPPSLTPQTARVGEPVVATSGRYVPAGGGTVQVVAREFRLDGVAVATGGTYTPAPADLGAVLSYAEVVDESGGSAPGSLEREVVLGPVSEASIRFDASQPDFSRADRTFDRAA